MLHRESNSISRRSLLAVVSVLILAMVVGVSVAVGQHLVQPDGRLNQIAHFGGDALYCVDQHGIATNRLAAFAEGSLRLLDARGQVLWSVPSATIDAAVATLAADGDTVMVASGLGSYGPVELHAYLSGGNAVLLFTGYDEHGKPNSLTLNGCAPVGPEADVEETEAEIQLCTRWEFEFIELSFGMMSGRWTSSIVDCGICGGPSEEMESGYPLCNDSLPG